MDVFVAIVAALTSLALVGLLGGSLGVDSRPGFDRNAADQATAPR